MTPRYALNAVSCLRVEAGQRLWAIVDEPLVPVAIEVARAAGDRGGRPLVVVVPESARPSREPDPALVAGIGPGDAVLLWLREHLPVEQTWRRGIYDRCREVGARVAYGGAMDDAILEHEMGADYPGIVDRCQRFLDAVRGAAEIRVTGEGGTDLAMRVEGREWKVDDGVYDQPGMFGNLPAGEIFIAPLEHSAEGVLVIDRAVGVQPELAMVDEPVHVTFRGGRVVDVAGGRTADAYRELITAPGADVIAELGIGANERARFTGAVMTDEKVLGSAHVAVGYNLHDYGGVNDSRVHCDGCFAGARIYADGRLVIAEGEVVA